MTYIVTPEAFRAAHPGLASKAWVEETSEGRFICFHNALLDRYERVQCDVPLCDSCDEPLADGCCCDEPLVEVRGDPMLRKDAA